MRHDREAHVDEVAWRVRERTELLVALAAGAQAELVDDHHADAAAACRAVDGEGSHLGDVRAERRQLGAADNLSRLDGDNEALRMDGELAEGAWQQVPLFEVGLDEREELLRVGGSCRPECDSRPRSSGHAPSPTAPSAASRRSSASSASGWVMTSGG